MNKVNRGKDFEEQIKTAFESIPDTYILRLIDPQGGYAGVRNPCDFIAYNAPTMFLIECKSCYGNTLPFNNITSTQWRELRNAVDYPGVVAGYMIWFIDHDLTIFVSADEVITQSVRGKKSINVNQLDQIKHTKIVGKKKRVLFDYDLTDWMNKEKTNGKIQND